MPESLYKVTDIKFSYQMGSQRVEALRGVDLEIPKKSFLCLRGPSGSGKTTLLNLLGLIEPVQSGALRFEGQDIKALSEKQRNQLRKFRLAFVFQNFHLMNVLRADENVEYFLARQGIGKIEREERVEKALRAVGLLDHRKKRPLEMSGGQRQRIAIARAIAKNPDVIIADEPTASLDQKTGLDIMGILQKMHSDNQVSIIVSSHDPMVHRFAPWVIDLSDGLIEKQGN
jgi:putative ABC transport system ATP-binding protein